MNLAVGRMGDASTRLPPPPPPPSGANTSREGIDAGAAERSTDDAQRPADTPSKRHSIQDYLLREYGIRLSVPKTLPADGRVAQGESPASCSCGCLLEAFRFGPFQGLPDHRPWALFCFGCLRFFRLSALSQEAQSILIDWGKFRRPIDEIRTQGGLAAHSTQGGIDRPVEPPSVTRRTT
jgi:hypothetical protein